MTKTTKEEPQWAREYEAKEFPPYAYTGDTLFLAINDKKKTVDLEILSILRGREPYREMEALPGGFVDWTKDATAKIAAMRELREETGTAAPEFFETLDTYDQNGRDPRQYAGDGRGVRVVSKAFLAIGPKPKAMPAPLPGEDADKAHWMSVYKYLPWEDLRTAAGRKSRDHLRRALTGWAVMGADKENQMERVDAAFGARNIKDRSEWNEERCGERVRLLLEAGLLGETGRDVWGRGAGMPEHGTEMAFDHRQMLADALGRARGKLKYIPAVLAAFATNEPRTIKWLHEACEAISGRPIYLTNLQRALTKTQAVVTRTSKTAAREDTRGGPAPALYSFSKDTETQRLDPSIRMPWAPIPKK